MINSQIRDYQRTRLYTWERQHVQTLGVNRAMDLADCTNLAAKYGVTKVGDGRRRRSACASSAWSISLPRWGRQLVVVCHEIAHCRLWHRKDIAAHGPEFAAKMIILIAKEARISPWPLYASAVDCRVEVDKAAIERYCSAL